MKSLARSYVWWSGQTADIEDLVKTCTEWTDAQNTPKKVPLLLWPWATEPWQRVHIDFLEIKGQMFIIFIYGYSKWPEVIPVQSTTAQATITVCKSLFAWYGLPSRIVTDNGPQFIADQLKTFLAGNGIEHSLCPPYHPASNGQAEVGVQTFKRMFKKFSRDLPLQDKVSNILFHSRNTPHSVTGKMPSELFLKKAHKPREQTPSASTSRVPSIFENPEVVPTPQTPKVVKVKPEVVPVRKSSRTIKLPVKLTY